MSLTGFKARTLDVISRAIRGDLRRELPGSDATVWPNTLAVLSKVFAMAMHLVELRAEWIYRQIFASTAEIRQLERHAYEYGLSRKPAQAARGQIETQGAADAIYPAGLAWLSGTVRYLAASEVRSDAEGLVRFFVVAESTGGQTNRGAGEEMVLVDAALAPTLVALATVDAGGIGGGCDAESDESLRSRVLDRKRRPPQGGATSDYEQIARSMPGVTRAWAYSWANGPGTVGIWFTFEGRPSGIPNQADVDALQDWIDSKRLIRARCVVAAPVPEPVDIFIGGLTNDNVAVRDQIRQNLEAMFAARAQPGVATDPFSLSASWIHEAIAQAVGEDRHYLISPTADILRDDGSIPVLGTITYV